MYPLTPITRYSDVDFEANWKRAEEQAKRFHRECLPILEKVRGDLGSLRRFPIIEKGSAMPLVSIKGVDVIKDSRLSLENLGKSLATVGDIRESLGRLEKVAGRLDVEIGKSAHLPSLSWPKLSAAQFQSKVRLTELPKVSIAELKIEGIPSIKSQDFKEVFPPKIDLEFKRSLTHASEMLKRTKSLEPMLERIREIIMVRAMTILKEAGYDFMLDFLTFPLAQRIIGFKKGNSGGALTKRLSKNMTSPSFFEEFLGPTLKSCKRARRWWKAVSEALDCHARGHYRASISTLFPVVEGLVNDCLHADRLAYDNGKKMFEKKNGKVTKTYLPGLDSKIKLVKTAGRFQTFADSLDRWGLIAEGTKKRNRISHGNVAAQSDCKLSVKLLLMAVVGAYALAEKNPPLTNVVFG